MSGSPHISKEQEIENERICRLNYVRYLYKLMKENDDLPFVYEIARKIESGLYYDSYRFPNPHHHLHMIDFVEEMKNMMREDSNDFDCLPALALSVYESFLKFKNGEN